MKCVVCGDENGEKENVFCQPCGRGWRDSPEMARAAQAFGAAINTARDDFVRRVQAERRNGGRS